MKLSVAYQGRELPDWQTVLKTLEDFKNAPRESSDYLLLVVVLLLLWLLLRRRDTRKEGDLKRSATDVLEERYRAGELSKEAYDRARGDLTLRHKGR